MKPQKHERGKKRLALNSQRESQALKKIGWEYHSEGETLPDSIRVYQVKVVSAAGVPLNKSMDLLYQLPSNLRQVLPFILHEEISHLKKEIANKTYLHHL